LILGGEDAPVIDLTAELAAWAAAPVGAF
jgi:hypothetical protein